MTREGVLPSFTYLGTIYQFIVNYPAASCGASVQYYAASREVLNLFTSRQLKPCQSSECCDNWHGFESAANYVYEPAFDIYGLFYIPAANK